jgi:outer membrane protein assembly factor BamB
MTLAQKPGHIEFQGLDKKTGNEIWKRQVHASIDKKRMMLINGTLYYVGSKLEQGKWNNTLYAVNPSNGKTKWDAAMDFASLLYDKGKFYSSFQTDLYSFSISNREETFLLDWVGSSVSENCHLQGFTETVQVGSLLCKAIYLIENCTIRKLIVKTYDISTNEPAGSCSIENDGLSSDLHLTTDGKLIYFSSWGNALCVAIDPKTQNEKWRIEIEDYWIDQVYPAFNKVYLVLSQYTMFGKHQLPHSQIVLGVNPKTGEIIKRSPIVTYSGIALIEGTYKNNLITQGQNGAFLEFYSISDQ